MSRGNNVNYLVTPIPVLIRRSNSLTEFDNVQNISINIKVGFNNIIGSSNNIEDSFIHAVPLRQKWVRSVYTVVRFRYCVLCLIY